MGCMIKIKKIDDGIEQEKKRNKKSYPKKTKPLKGRNLHPCLHGRSGPKRI